MLIKGGGKGGKGKNNTPDAGGKKLKGGKGKVKDDGAEVPEDPDGGNG